jgi:predicted metal-dependent HD superfamily phosphohydrolase
MEQTLLHRWMDFTSRLGAANDKSLVFGMNVIESYQEQGRFYHNDTHLRDVLDKLDWAKDALQASGEMSALDDAGKKRMFDMIEMALWYHDVIYDAKAKDSEARSRDLFIEHAKQMNLPQDFISEVAALIDLTAKHTAAQTLTERIMTDCDLAILGADKKTFAKYDADIRKEYAHVPAALYKVGRPKVLRHFRDQPRIFKTDAFKERFEDAARSNLDSALQTPVQRIMQRFKPF